MGRRRSPSSASLFRDLPELRPEQGRDLPRIRPDAGASRLLPPSPVQPDLLDWAPPATHLPAPDVEMCVLGPSGFRPPSGGAFLYHLATVDTARTLVADGLPLMDGLIFRSAAHLVEDLAHVSAMDEMAVVRVRRRLIQPWLTEDRQDGRPCYVLGPVSS